MAPNPASGALRPAVVGVCDDAKLDATLTCCGRDLHYEWEWLDDEAEAAGDGGGDRPGENAEAGEAAAALRVLLQESAGLSAVTIPSELMLPGHTYTVQMRVQTALGGSGEAKMSFEKAAHQLHSVLLNGAPTPPAVPAQTLPLFCPRQP